MKRQHFGRITEQKIRTRSRSMSELVQIRCDQDCWVCEALPMPGTQHAAGVTYLGALGDGKERWHTWAPQGWSAHGQVPDPVRYPPKPAGVAREGEGAKAARKPTEPWDGT